MIRIDEEYLINANENCYTLERISKVEDINSKNYGKETRTIQGYYTTIENALNGYIKYKTRKYMSKETENTFTELMDMIKKIESNINQKLKGA